MKSILLFIILSLSLCNNNFAKSINCENQYCCLIKPEKKIDVTYKSTNGYTVHIVGELTHNWSYTSWTFSGNVTITGNGTNINFPVSTQMGLRISGNGKEATEVLWTTDDGKANDILNSEEVVNLFLEDININSN